MNTTCATFVVFLNTQKLKGPLQHTHTFLNECSALTLDRVLSGPGFFVNSPDRINLQVEPGQANFYSPDMGLAWTVLVYQQMDWAGPGLGLVLVFSWDRSKDWPRPD